MPEVKQNLEQTSEQMQRPESLPKVQEIKEGIKTSEKFETIEKVREKEIQAPGDIQPQAAQTQVKAKAVKYPLSSEIEDILEEGLQDIYLKLPEEKQREFKIRGEEAINQIAKLLNEVKVKVKKIIQAIAEWLRIIPGVNKFFIKQTAKIKTDKILALKNQNNTKI